ncbi:hypothetical protein ACLMJK_006543 [Lecanora helva]
MAITSAQLSPKKRKQAAESNEISDDETPKSPKKKQREERHRDVDFNKPLNSMKFNGISEPTQPTCEMFNPCRISGNAPVFSQPTFTGTVPPPMGQQPSQGRATADGSTASSTTTTMNNGNVVKHEMTTSQVLGQQEQSHSLARNMTDEDWVTETDQRLNGQDESQSLATTSIDERWPTEADQVLNKQDEPHSPAEKTEDEDWENDLGRSLGGWPSRAATPIDPEWAPRPFIPETDQVLNEESNSCAKTPAEEEWGLNGQDESHSGVRTPTEEEWMARTFITDDKRPTDTDQIPAKYDELLSSRIKNQHGHKEYDKLPWVKSIYVPIKHPSKTTPVGYCSALLIDREPIRAHLLEHGGQKICDLASMGLGIFDSWGTLKLEFYEGGVRRGSSIWGSELNYGRILVIEAIVIEKKYQHQGLGRKAFNEIWEMAQELSQPEDNEGQYRPGTYGCDFAIVCAEPVDLGPSGKFCCGNSLLEGKESHCENLQDCVQEFWKALGFRRVGTSPYFCFAKDPAHPSRKLEAQEDWRLFGPSRPEEIVTSSQGFPYSRVFLAADDLTTKAMLEERLKRGHKANDPVWLMTDLVGNNVLHVVVQQCKPVSVAWLLQQPFARKLKSMRNHNELTPSDILEDQLGNRKINRWHGFTRVRTHDASPFTFNCTCGQCIDGVVSPRTKWALVRQTRKHRKTLLDMKKYESLAAYGHLVKYFCHRIQVKLALQESFRIAFGDMLECIESLLRCDWLPTYENFFAYYLDGIPSHIDEFEKFGGYLPRVVETICDCAMNQDIYLGDGEHQPAQEKKLARLPMCENDNHLLAVRNHLCSNGCTPEDEPRVHMARIFADLMI